MRTLATPAVLWLALFTGNVFCQTSVPDDQLAGRSLATTEGVPIVESPARDYQDFFDAVKDLGRWPLSVEARKTLHLSDQELHSLVAITADLATESLFFRQIWRPWKFESLMEIVESGSLSPSLQEKLRDLQDQWAQKIRDHAQRLKAAIGQDRFREVDEFIHSGKSMFATPQAKPIVKAAQ